MELDKSNISVNLSLESGEIFQGVNSLDFWYQDFLRLNPQAAEKIDNFLDRVWDKYGDGGLNYIGKALKIATVGYQYNHNTEKRFRKEKDEQGKPIPTLYHSLEMAERLVRDNFNTVGVAAILLHDVPEDVKLEIVENRNVRTIEGDQWFEIISNEFKDSDESDLLIDLIKGLTEKELPDTYTGEGREVRDRLHQTQLFKMIQAYVGSGRIKGKKKKDAVYGEEREAIYEVVFNLEKLFDSAFKSEKHLQLLLLKITDIWHNFHSPDWVKPAKILRGRLAASLAEWMGWYSMRSEIIESLAEITDTNRPYAPDITHKFTPGKYKKDVELFENFAEESVKYILKNLDIDWDEDKFFGGWPIINARDDYSSWQGTTLPPPEFIYSLPRGYYKKYIEWPSEEGNLRFLVKRPGNKFKRSISQADSQKWRDAALLSRDVGRGRVDYKVSVGKYPSYMLRIEIDEPHVIDAFRQFSDVKLIEVPEARGLFSGKLFGTKHWNTHSSSLIGFLYDFNLPLILGSGIFLIFDSGSIYFFDGEHSLQEILNVLGKDGNQRIFSYWGDEIQDDNLMNKKLNDFSYMTSRKSFRSRTFLIQ